MNQQYTHPNLESESGALPSTNRSLERLEIFTFGGLRLVRNGQPVANTGSRRVEALLAYLACADRPQPRELLADLLWDDRPQQQAMSNLRTVLSGLRKHFGPFVSITRAAVEMTPAAKVWLDVSELTEYARMARAGNMSMEVASRITRAMSRFNGEFLEGFYLRGGRGFELWLLQTRETQMTRLLDTLDRLVEFHLDHTAPAAGIPLARQRLQLDPLSEAGYRRLMHLLAADGQRLTALAQFEACRQMLNDEFGVEPEAETIALVAQIRGGELPRVTEASRIDHPSTPSNGPSVPDFLQKPASPAETPTLFVARNRELARLDEQLVMALDGRGQVALVTGEAGRGKSSLLSEFARRAQDAYPTLVAASGVCNAYLGAGDPYLPFRELLAQLTGDVESRLAAGTISRGHAHRLWNLLAHSAQALVEHGPNLIETLIPAASLARRVNAANLPALANQITTLASQPRTPTATPQKYQIFEQVGQVLGTLANRQPLLLILDDLQWADSASVNLLFYLARQLVDLPIMLVGAYRPIELQAGSGPPAPFAPVAGELKRLFGDIELDLGRTPAAEGREFLDALLDSVPNRLDESFRAAMFGRTQGHPLFTVELLQVMQERGDLVQDEAGLWIEARPLDWDSLPPRVEAVIEQRLARLDDNAQEILSIAAVEGEQFTGQVVARLLGLSERKLLRQLSRMLGKRHRLVRAQGEVTVGENRLSRFQFRHALFQQYLYHQLSPGERRLLHRDIAAVLEELHAGHTGEISVALAHHYTEAGQGKQAIPHLLRAGDQARLAYAYEAAIEHYRQAVIFLKEQDDDRAADTLMKLGLTYHNAFRFEESRQAYDEAFALRQQPARHQSASEPAAEYTLRIAVWEPTSLDPALADDQNFYHQLFRGLVAETTELGVVPDVAQRWEILDGGRKYLFHLRPDARWSDGVPVTAHDFEYAWKRILNPATAAPMANLLYDVKNGRAFHQGRLTDAGQVGVRALDAATLAVELEEPTGYFLHLLACGTGCPVPRHLVEKYGPNWTAPEHIATNGPFRVERWLPGQSAVLRKNPYYHGPFSGNLERVELTISRWESDINLKRYETGELDVVLDLLPSEEMGRVRRRYAGDFIATPALQTTYIGFNLDHPPFDDVRVRQALALAIDKQTLVNSLFSGHSLPADGGFIPDGMPGFSADIGLPFDPDLARQRLADAGFPNGQRFPAVDWVVMNWKPMAEFLRAQWRDILGITLPPVQVEAHTSIASRLTEKNTALYLVGWVADFPDPAGFSATAAVYYDLPQHSTEYARLVGLAARTTDQETRLNLYRQADRILVNEALVIPLTYGRMHLLVKPWVKKYPISPANYWHWQDVVIEPEKLT